MAKEFKARRGNAAQHSVFTGAEAELTYNTDKKTFHAHDGITTGGFELARNDLSNVSNADFASKASASGISGGGGGSGGGLGGADANASYLIVGNDTWGLTNERRIQTGVGIEFNDGGSGGGFTILAKLANAVSGPPSNLGSASTGVSTFIARADHVHAMPTALDVGAIPNTRVLQVGTGLSISNAGVLTANATVSLSATLSDLTNVFIQNATNNDLLIYNGATSKWTNYAAGNLGRLSVSDENTVIGSANAITSINFLGNGVTAVADGSDPTKINVTVPNSLDQEAIEDIVGAMVSGNIESGITVTYNDTSGKLNFDVNDFTITLTGDVQGVATVTDLGNISLNTVIAANAIALGNDTTGDYVATIAAATVSNGIIVAGGTGESVAAEVRLNLADSNFVEGVQDIIGTMVSSNNETNISVIYDDANGKLDFAVPSFAVSLNGVITGTGTLSAGTISVTTAIAPNAVTLGQDTVGNYISSIAVGSANGIVITGSIGEGAVPSIDLNLASSTFREGVQDIVGGMVSGNTENGIVVTYNDAGTGAAGTGWLDFQVNPFTITMAGALSGSATVTNLANATINVSLAADSVPLGTATTGSYVESLYAAATSYGITVVNGSGEKSQPTIFLNVSDANFVEGVQDIVGSMVPQLVGGNPQQAGILVQYDDAAGCLVFNVNDFTITLTGDVTGTATVTDLGNVTITTTVAANSVALGPDTTGNYVATVAPATTSYGITVAGSGSETAAVTLALNPADANFVEAIQDIVGGMVSGNTEAGIAVTYNDATGVLDFDVADFTITLGNQLTGSATITNLGSVTLNAGIAADAVTLGTHTVGNYVASVTSGGNGIAVTGSGVEGAAVSVSLDVNEANFVEGVQDIVGTLFTGPAHFGITPTYNDVTGKILLTVQNGVVDAATLGSYAASAFGRKAEVAQITNQWNFNNGVWLNKTGQNYLYFGNAVGDSLVVVRNAGAGYSAVFNDDRTVNFGADVYYAGSYPFLNTFNFGTNPTVKEVVEDYVASLFSAGTHSNITVTYNDAAASLSLAISTAGLNADTLDGRDSSVFAKTNENTGITSSYNFYGSSNFSSINLVNSLGANPVYIVPAAAAGNYISGTVEGDTVIATRDHGLMIGYYTGNGIRFGESNIQIGGTVLNNGYIVLSQYNGYQKNTAHSGAGSFNIDTTVTGVATGNIDLDGSLQGWHVYSSYRADNSGYGTQFAISDTSASGNIMFRSKINGSNTAWRQIWTSVNDGAGSGLDADLLDGLQSTQFMRSDASTSFNVGQAANQAIFYSRASTLGTTSATAPLEIQSAGTSDAFMSFHNGGTFAANFGMDRSTSDLFVGGWSFGEAKYRVYHRGNSPWLMLGVNAQRNLTGGGVVTFSASGCLRWSQRFISISIGQGSSSAASGYFDITMPTTGTVITGVGGQANVTVTSEGIPLGTWCALYYVLTAGGANTSGEFRVASYTGALEVPHNWILLAIRNGDDSVLSVPPLGRRLLAGDQYSTTGGVHTWGNSFVPDADNTRNIGSGSARYANMYAVTFNGTATSARYADVAERYEADDVYEPGTVMVFGGQKEMTLSSTASDHRVAGVISTNPAYMMNSEAGEDDTHPYLALVGRVPCKVIGEIRKGDLLVTSNVPGHAMASSGQTAMGTVIGKALQNHPAGQTGVIEISVQRS